jgi:hypothetical protein
MAKNSLSDYDTTAANNTDVGGINVDASGNVSQGDDAIRALMSHLASYFRRGSDLATAATLDLDSVDSLFLDLTGTTTVTAVTLTATHMRMCRAASAFTLTASATLVVNGSTSTNASVQAGDYIIFWGYTSSTVRAWTLTGFSGSPLTAPADPGADRFYGWDDSAGAHIYFAPNPNLVFDTTNVRVYELIPAALSDETTELTTGTGKAAFVIPYNFTLVGVAASLTTASSSGTPTFDVNEDGVSLLGTKIVIDANELTGGSADYQGTAAGAATITDTAIAAFAKITWDIDVAGTGAKGAKGYLIGYRSA